MQAPSSTYRLQLSPTFPLRDLREILNYLDKLGISTIYAAPIFQAREGSTHGYDVLDPYKINKEIGNLESFKLIRDILNQKNMSWLQDIVPNHMAFNSNNPWLRDIFELGPASKYYNFFDIDWDYKDWNKVMAPFLGSEPEEVLKNKEIKMKFDAEGFSINYFEHSYPASARSYAKILASAEVDVWKEKFSSFSEGDMEWKNLKTSFYSEVQEDPQMNQKVHFALQDINKSEEKLKIILDLQFFLLTHWKHTEKEINYRRFFTINDLICLRMEDQKVFDAYHHYINQLCEEGFVNGLRIDHIDGLFDPAGYVEKLKNALGNDFYVIVEKILEWDENLPKKWPVEGTSGYDFLAEVNHLFTNKKNEAEFSEIYEKIYPKVPDYEDLVYEKKIFILKKRMGGELHNLWLLLQKNNLLPQNSAEKNHKKALSAFLAAFPVYRIYPKSYPLNERQQKTLKTAYTKAIEKAPEQENEINILYKLFLGEAEKEKEQMLYFLQRCQQFSGPLAAKGVEDTSFYIFNRLVSHNEVGDSPENFGISVSGFHDKMLERQKYFPLGVNATATHDTKRGEDARMRLNVLSEIPQEWFEKVKEWKQISSEIRKNKKVPGKNEEYFIYQALIGATPFEVEEEEKFLQRTKDYLQKVLREAKVHSNWSEPDEAYENDVFDFVEDIFKNKKFRNSFDLFQKKIAQFGAVKSLGQLLIKVTVPGVPDIYQGTELWDLSYVDPDNRRPVKYSLRESYISDFENFNSGKLNEEIKSLKHNYKSGKIKMYSLYKALNERKNHEELFKSGKYLPLEISGEHAENFIAFARGDGENWMIIIVPVLVTEIFNSESFELKSNFKVSVSLPEDFPQTFINTFTNEEISSEGKINVAEVLKNFPVALLKNKK